MHLGSKVKIGYLVSYIELLLINKNHVEIHIYIFFLKFINTNNFDNFLHLLM